MCYLPAVPADTSEAGLGWGLAVTIDLFPARRARAGSRMPAEPSKPSPSVGDLAGLGLFLAVIVALPLVGGLFIDQAVHTSPLGLLVGLLLGIGAAVMVLWAQLRRYL